jgi:pimeloyl-ACP methyl ester carboxylesterase
LRRLLRRVAIAVAVFAVAVTVAAFGYDLASNGDMRPATELYRGPFLRVDGTLLAYRHWGTHGSPIVLLGGFAEPSWVWHEVGPLLGRTHRVYALDLPPFGYSQRRGPYTLARWTQLTLGFARRLGLDRPVVVGHSLGAAVAVDAALAAPMRVRGIVLLDGDALPGRGPPHWLPKLVLLPPWYTAAFRLATGSDFLVKRVLAGAWPDHPPFTHAVLEQFKRPFRVDGSEAGFRSTLSEGIQGVSLADLARVRTPRVVIWGTQDTVDSVSAGRATASALHARFVLVPGAGHLSMLGAPDRVARSIEGFISSLRTS